MRIKGKPQDFKKVYEGKGHPHSPATATTARVVVVVGGE